MIQQSTGAGGYLNSGEASPGPTDRDRDAADHDHEGTTEDHEQELRRAVEFAKLLAWSSLGTQEALDDRLCGRRAIEEREARLRDVLGEDPDAVDADPGVRREAEFDFEVAEALELRGYTFEAELRFHRLATRPRAALRLAQLVEAKGFPQEALELYVRAARSNVPDALLRIAVMCWRQDEVVLARRLAASAWSAIDRRLRTRISRSLDGLRRARRAPGAGRRPGYGTARTAGGRHTAVPDIGSGESGYALATLLLVGAGRDDLARLGYCSAVTQGSTLAALSLLDLAPGDHDELMRARLRELVDRRFPESGDAEEAVLPRRLETFCDPLGDTPVGDLPGLARWVAHGEDEVAAAAAERLVHVGRAVTCLWAFARTECSTSVRSHVDDAANRVADHVAATIGADGPEPALLDGLVATASAELARGRAPRRAADPREELPRPDDRKDIPASGTVHRLHREFRLFPDDQLTIVVLRLAGLRPAEVAAVVRTPQKKIEEVLRLSTAQLHAGQSGEHDYHRSTELLWAELESWFADRSEEAF